MIWQIAWRNVWRNKTRSIIVLTAVALGLFASIFLVGFMNGMVDMRLKTALKTEISHIQIHHNDYMLNEDVEFTVENSDEIINKINEKEEVDGASRRLKSEGMLYTAHGNRMIKIMGIEPENEMNVTDISERIVDGNYFESMSKRTPPILIGEKLANKLDLKIKSKIPVQLIDRHGNISQKNFKVCGIYKTNNTGYDQLNVFVRFDDLKEQLSMNDGQAHEIAVYLKPEADVLKVKEEITNQFAIDDPTIEVLYWKQLSKELALMIDMMDKFILIFVMIVLIALCFSIINTMLMAVLERVKELGMLMAVGMNRARVFMMIMLESIYLSFTGGIIGIIAGSVLCKIHSVKPLNLESFTAGMEQYGYSSEVYTLVNTQTVITIAIMVVILGVLSAIYPARKATKLDPAEAVRSE